MGHALEGMSKHIAELIVLRAAELREAQEKRTYSNYFTAPSGAGPFAGRRLPQDIR